MYNDAVYPVGTAFLLAVFIMLSTKEQTVCFQTCLLLLLCVKRVSNAFRALKIKRQEERRSMKVKKNLHSPLALLLCLLVCTALVLSGCQNKAEGAAKPDTPPVEQTQTRIVTDHAGRQVELPAVIDSVYSTSPVGTMLMYTFDDKMVTGLNVILSEEEKTYYTDHYVNLPHLGGWYGQGNQGNIEEIIKAAPDMVLASGTTQSNIDQADQLQKQLGIPVLLVKSDLGDLAATYRFLGELFSRKERGEELAKYTEETLAEAQKIAAGIPEEKKVRVYYAEEKDGLHTDPSGSSHSQLIDLCGGINVADCDITPGYGRTAVTIEQVMTWDPDLIICSIDNGFADSSSYITVTTDAKWNTISAVKNGLVFQTPLHPQNWFDRPPSVNTIIGIKWTLSILYPESIDFDIREEAKEFYKLFYHIELTDKDVDFITDKALRD